MQENPGFGGCVLPPKETRLSESELDLDFACMHMHAVTNMRANANSHTKHTLVLYYGDTDGFSAAQLCLAHIFPVSVCVYVCFPGCVYMHAWV